MNKLGPITLDVPTPCRLNLVGLMDARDPADVFITTEVLRTLEDIKANLGESFEATMSVYQSGCEWIGWGKDGDIEKDMDKTKSTWKGRRTYRIKASDAPYEYDPFHKSKLVSQCIDRDMNSAILRMKDFEKFLCAHLHNYCANMIYFEAHGDGESMMDTRFLDFGIVLGKALTSCNATADVIILNSCNGATTAALSEVCPPDQTGILLASQDMSTVSLNKFPKEAFVGIESFVNAARSLVAQSREGTSLLNVRSAKKFIFSLDNLGDEVRSEIKHDASRLIEEKVWGALEASRSALHSAGQDGFGDVGVFLSALGNLYISEAITSAVMHVETSLNEMVLAKSDRRKERYSGISFNTEEFLYPVLAFARQWKV